jgi:hypothetical protein
MLTTLFFGPTPEQIEHRKRILLLAVLTFIALC